jgi:uncharacterized membrane protein YgcG
MRRVSFALVLLLVFASAATGVQVHASTECERWISDYRTQLANSDLMKRANAASHRLHHYVHRKVAALNKPKPHPTRVLPARLQRPKMTREEMLRELEFACGDLPLDPVNLKQPVSFSPEPNFALGPMVEDDSGTGPLQNGPQGLLASNDGPEQSSGWNPGGMGGGGAPGWGGGGGGGVGGNGGGGGNHPPTGGPGGDNPPPPPDNPPPTNPPPTAVAPEPGSLLLVATGVLGAAGAIRRRFKQPV